MFLCKSLLLACVLVVAASKRVDDESTTQFERSNDVRSNEPGQHSRNIQVNLQGGGNHLQMTSRKAQEQKKRLGDVVVVIGGSNRFSRTNPTQVERNSQSENGNNETPKRNAQFNLDGGQNNFNVYSKTAPEQRDSLLCPGCKL